MAKKKADPKDFSVKWGDVPLLLEDPYGSVAKWINDWMPLALGNFWSPSQVQGGEVLGSRYVDGTAEIPFPKPCWSQLPTPRLNVLVWPNGASRWAYGLFLIDGKSFKKVTEKKDYTNRSFVVYDRGEKVIDTKMYALPPQPVSNGGGQPRDASKKKNAPPASDGNLYILPLVCPRYFWQFSMMEASTTAESDTASWNTLLADVNASIPPTGSIDYTDPPIDDALYFRPDWHHTLKRRERSVALADAAAASVGGHLVALPESGGPSLRIARWGDYPRGSDGDTAGLKPTDENPFIAGVHDTDEIVRSRSLYPAKFRVAFRKYKWGRVLRSYWEKTYNIDDAAIGGSTKDSITGLEKVILSTAYAKVARQEDGDGNGGDPDNKDDLETLAEQLAKDAYHRWTWMPAVQCVAGIYNLVPDDSDTQEKIKALSRADYVEFHLGARCDVHIDDYDSAAGVGGNSRYRSFTRWVGLPQNFGPDVNLCQFPAMPTYYSPAFFELHTPDATEGDNATMIDTASDGTTADNYAKLWSEIIPIASHTGDVIAYWNANNEKWQVMQKECT